MSVFHIVNFQELKSCSTSLAPDCFSLYSLVVYQNCYFFKAELLVIHLLIQCSLLAIIKYSFRHLAVEETQRVSACLPSEPVSECLVCSMGKRNEMRRADRNELGVEVALSH